MDSHKNPHLQTTTTCLLAAREDDRIRRIPPPPPAPAAPPSLQAEEASSSRRKMMEEESGGREKLKRHRLEMAGRVWIPDIWGQEDLLKNWIDCTVFDSSLKKSNIMSAREALIQEAATSTSTLSC